ncbi:NfeD family protein [Tianweitania sediminis]|jgi:hypothetical protein|uniref:NfeD family protein n=1 Tax=Tianweitania sediminis TaxID=1502156 RepID=A0A8J7ULD4_9HYPH|nr:NfeD family protein [Tianweitania sediminis]MBP0439297.1 NfeD family protein [Tianweitania sediminis]HEV7415627.1 NfeD family protein [Tianweitania sediminis]
MITTTLGELGPWNWILLGMVLLAAEIVLPGVFLLWIGIAALLVGALSLQIWEMAAWTWQLQTILFLVLALASAYLGSRWVRVHDTASDEPLLNQPATQLIGRTAVLGEPIRENRGRIRLGDTIWLVQGADADAGTRVKVVGTRGSELLVEPTERA